MEYIHFTTVLLSYKKFLEDMSSLHKMGFDLFEGKFNLDKPIELMLSACIKSHYGEEGWEWVSWFIWESEFGEKDWSRTKTFKQNQDGTSELVEPSVFGAYDENGNPICYSYESLWKYLEAEHKHT